MEAITKEKTIEKLTEHMAGQMKEGQVLESVYFKTENILNGRIGLPVEVRYENTAKTGRVTTKKETIMFYPPFDPFTGEKTGS